MNEPVYLVVWLIALFGLLGCVVAGVVRLVKRDTTEHDRRYVWKNHRQWPPEDDGNHPLKETKKAPAEPEP